MIQVHPFCYQVEKSLGSSGSSEAQEREAQEPVVCGPCPKNLLDNQSLAPYSGRIQTMLFHGSPALYLIRPSLGENYFPPQSRLHTHEIRLLFPSQQKSIWVPQIFPFSSKPRSYRRFLSSLRIGYLMIPLSGLFLEYNSFAERVHWATIFLTFLVFFNSCRYHFLVSKNARRLGQQKPRNQVDPSKENPGIARKFFSPFHPVKASACQRKGCTLCTFW